MSLLYRALFGLMAVLLVGCNTGVPGAPAPKGIPDGSYRGTNNCVLTASDSTGIIQETTSQDDMTVFFEGGWVVVSGEPPVVGGFSQRSLGGLTFTFVVTTADIAENVVRVGFDIVLDFTGGGGAITLIGSGIDGYLLQADGVVKYEFDMLVASTNQVSGSAIRIDCDGELARQ